MITSTNKSISITRKAGKEEQILGPGGGGGGGGLRIFINRDQRSIFWAFNLECLYFWVVK